MNTSLQNTMTATPPAKQDLRETILDCLATFANQRPGVDPRNYGGGMDGWRAYRSESRSITRDLHDFRTLLSAVRWRSSIDAERLQAAFRAFSGRLTIKVCPHGQSGKVTCGNNPKHVWCELCDPAPSALCHWCNGRGYSDAKPGKVTLDYCTGQYFPTEYRKAACAVLASALWDWTRDLAMPKGELRHNSETGETLERYDGLRVGDWLRRNFRREFGARMQKRWFD